MTNTSSIPSYSFDKTTGFRLDLPDYIAPGTKTLCLYRVSSNKQLYHTDKNEADIPMQRIRCRQFAEAQGWTIVCELSEEGVSGHKVRAEKRDKVQLIREYALQKKFDILLVFMFDRIGRIEDETPFVVEWLVQEAGVRVCSAEEGEQCFESHTDKLINYIRFWQADGESRKISLRTSNSLHILTEAGYFTGGVCPYGYSFVQTGRTNKRKQPVNDLAICEDEAAIVRIMFRLAADEGYGAQRIANHLNVQKIKNRLGKNWHPATIQAMLKNVLYVGVLRSGEVKSEPLDRLRIVDEKTFNTVNEMLEARSRKTEAIRSKPLNTRGNALLSGFIFCGHCGARLCVTTSGKYGRKKDNAYTIRTRYTCQTKSRTHGECDGQTGYTVEKLDAIIDHILRFIFSKVRRLDRQDVLNVCYQNDLTEKTAILKKLRLDYTTAERNYQMLTAEIINALAGESAFSPDVLNATIEEQAKKCAQLKETIRQMETELSRGQNRAVEIAKQYDDLLNWANAYDTASMSAKKVIASHMIDRVDVFRGYKLNVKLNISVEQFLSGLDIELGKNALEAESA